MAPRSLRRARRAELPVDTFALARRLVGAFLVSRSARGVAAGRIVETEAYVPGDPASHAFRGETPRNRVMFGPRGFAYVYFIYGNHFCINVTAGLPGEGTAVLIRAAEPAFGLELIRERRGDVAELDLMRGPGRLARALGVDGSFDGRDLCAPGPLTLAFDPNASAARVGTSTRIGLTKNAAVPWRYYETGSRYVSGPRRFLEN